MKKFLALSLVFIVAVIFIFVIQNKKIPLTTTQITSQNSTSENSASYKISSGVVPNISLQLPTNYVVHVFASGLGSPRVLQFSPNGTLLVTNPAGNNVYALPDKNNDGVTDEEKVVISGENHVHGLAFFDGKLYIADVDKVVRYNFDESNLTATLDKVLFALPGNNDHNNRTLTFNSSGFMFVTVGSTCNVCRETPEQGGSVWVSNANGDNPKIFASGLRNAAFTAINPATNELWGSEMGRDYLGDNTPPDEINIIKEGQNFGWPNCYADKIHDTNFDKSSNNPCNSTTSPIYQIPAHSAPLGITFINSSQFPADWQGDLLVALHGSWNRSTAIGYKVVHLNVSGNTILGSDDFLTGFLQGSTKDSSLGRPVDMAFDKSGNLYLSDDKAGNIYIIQKK